MSFDSQGVSKNVRAKVSLESKMDKVSVPGHWIWTGEVTQVFRYPALRSAAGGFSPASEVVYHAWTGMVRPAGLERRCEHSLCVRPDCWSVR